MVNVVPSPQDEKESKPSAWEDMKQELKDIVGRGDYRPLAGLVALLCFFWALSMLVSPYVTQNSPLYRALTTVMPPGVWAVMVLLCSIVSLLALLRRQWKMHKAITFAQSLLLLFIAGSFWASGFPISAMTIGVIAFGTVWVYLRLSLGYLI